MNASLVDLRRKTRKITEAIEQRQEVTLSKRGKRIATIVPYQQPISEKFGAVAEHPAVGMWADHDDTKDVATTVRKLRRGRFDDL
jgi:antitoxin (DNA-binding transcriptional repressor) of toxin-antitoxin stability system